MGQVMTIKAFSWFLAAAYLVFGVAFFRVISAFNGMFLNMGMPLPVLTRPVLFIGPVGWLVLAVFGAVIIVLKDLKVKSSLPNVFFGVVLILTVLAVFIAMTQPYFGPVEDLR